MGQMQKRHRKLREKMASQHPLPSLEVARAMARKSSIDAMVNMCKLMAETIRCVAEIRAHRAQAGNNVASVQTMTLDRQPTDRGNIDHILSVLNAARVKGLE